MKKTIAFILALVMVLSLCAISACADENKKYDYTFGVAMNSMDEFRTQWLKEFTKLTDEAGITLSVTNADSDANKQISDIESLIVKGVDILVVTPCSKGAADPALETAAAAKIPVILIDFESVLGTLIGCTIIGIISNVLNLAGVSSFYQWICKGVIILAALLLDSFAEHFAAERQRKMASL